MGEFADDPLTEPELVPCLYVTGAAVEAGPHVLRIVGWVALPDLGGETTQRRIVLRCAMALDTARLLRSDLTRKLRGSGH